MCALQARRRWPLGVLAMLLTAALSPAGAAGDARRGEYLVRAAGCVGCHTDADNGGPLMAGGPALRSPFGTFYAPNITPDAEHGIGRWSDGDFLRAMKLGVRPGGGHYFPTFPYMSYANMRREDVLAIKAYLFELAPVAQADRAHELVGFARYRPLMFFWKLMFFDAEDFTPSADRTPAWNRGAYLVRGLAHCGECHTPRDRLGVPRSELYLAGTRSGPAGKTVPNITPERETGIGRWSEDELVRYLRSGATPEGDYAGGLMAEVIDNGLRYLSDADLGAIAQYVLSGPPIVNPVRVRKNRTREYEFE